MDTIPTPESGPATGPPDSAASFGAWLDAIAAAGGPRGPDGLRGARRLFALLADPQNRVPCVHLVGTAGKGTTAHLITKRLVDAGLTVATHMSPHVHDPRERFLLDGALPDWSDVTDAAEEVHDAVQRVRHGTGPTPTYFAVTAAMSWVMGRNAGTDMLVIEAGIGGRTDATNVIDRPDRLVVVTAIGLDHTDVLGSTVREIAEEKAAVAAGCGAVVLGPQTEPVVAEVVAAAARGAGVELEVVPASQGGGWRVDCDATAAAVERRITGSATPTDRRFDLPPGRMETIAAEGRRIVLDGAHNPVKLMGLVTTMDLDCPDDVKCVVAALGRGKHLTTCAEILGRLAPLVIATRFDTDPGGSGRSPRSWPGGDLARAVAASSPSTRVVVAPDVGSAMDLARRSTTDGDTILVTGSFMHLAAAKQAVKSWTVS